jgi:hypothetical protein
LVPCQRDFVAELRLRGIRTEEHGSAGFQKGRFEGLSEPGSIAFLQWPEYDEVRQSRRLRDLVCEIAENFAE